MEKEFCVDVTSPTPQISHVGSGWRRRRREASSSSPASPAPSPDAEEQEGKQVISVLSGPSPTLSPAQYFPKIAAAVTFLSGSSSSSSSPRPAMENRHRTPPLNQSPSRGGSEVRRMHGKKTQVIIQQKEEEDEDKEEVKGGMRRKGKKQVIIMEDANKEEEEEEEMVGKEGVKRKAPRLGALSQVNNNPSYLESGKLGHQVRDGAVFTSRLPRSFGHLNTSLPLPPMASPGGADGWGLSAPQAESAARLNERGGVLQSPSLHPEDSEDFEEDPLAYNPYHPGGFGAGVPGEFEDHVGHGLVPSGGFGEVVPPLEKPQPPPDTNQFFHGNEVTVR
ncbi:hypothetical protein E2C01_072191 [Portunus trituberculatus]|uniref:Uncharacterized protein n=1 Tax=Portunus trituberculatus TaxID=210409 RepID=A0A5B7I8A3_PORTR|nr:hypothetical protein [Portunus trituberculatus]